MARNPNKKHCSVPGCRAWAKRGTDLCASHSRSTSVATRKLKPRVGVPGVPEGNGKPAESHRRPGKSAPSGAGIREATTRRRGIPSLDDEIALLAARRDAVDRWMMQRLAEGEEVDALRYLALIGQIGSRIARMLKTRQALGGSGDLIEGLFTEALDLLNERVDAEV